MLNRKFTVEFDTLNKFKLKNGVFCWQNISPDVSDCVIKFSRGQCILLLTIKSLDNKHIDREIAIAYAHSLADILSWQYNIPLKYVSIKAGDKKRIGSKIKYTEDFIHISSKIFNRGISSAKEDLLSAYREAKNEDSNALRYIIYFRLLELFASEERVDPDHIIRTMLQNIKIVINKRNKKRSYSVIKHIRNKIHPTNNSYKFPYRSFDWALNKVENVIRKKITERLGEETRSATIDKTPKEPDKTKEINGSPVSRLLKP